MLKAIALTAGAAYAAVKHAPMKTEWTAAGDAASFEKVSFQLAIKEQNMDKIASAVKRISDPRSTDYGHFLSSQEIQAMTKPRSEDMDTVVNWLKTTPGVHFDIVNDRTITVSTTVEEASKLLSTEFKHLMSTTAAGENTLLLRASDYILPAAVEEVVSVFGLHGLPLPKAPILLSHEAPSAVVDVTPSVLVDTYGIKGVTAKRTTTNRMAVEEFQGQTEDDADLVSFFKKYITNYKTGTDDKIYKFVGDADKQDPETEAELDIQYIMGVAPGIKSEFWYYANYDFCGDLKNWTDMLVSTDDIPHVHSISYGWQGDLAHIGCAMDNVKAVDANFAKLAAKGVSIIFASGDSGSGYSPPQVHCSNRDLKKDTALEGHLLIPKFHVNSPLFCCDEVAQYAGFSYQPLAPKQIPQTGAHSGEAAFNGECSIYSIVTGTKSAPNVTSGQPKQPDVNITLYPSWPASSPYVTAVGATRFTQKAGSEEMASDQFGSGGGFSTMFDQTNAQWQVEAVKAYTSNPPDDPHYPPAGSFPPTGRATPDVSALGEGYQVLIKGVAMAVGGTSASAPAFAGMVALLNEAREQHGKGPLGFLNPFLYSNADCFTDITLGTNAIGRGTGPIKFGFNATKGWDPATGLGVPVFSKLLQAALAK